MKTQLFEQLDFVENPLYEVIIDDLLQRQYSIVDDFFNAEEVHIIRDSLKQVYEDQNVTFQLDISFSILMILADIESPLLITILYIPPTVPYMRQKVKKHMLPKSID